ncbi:oxidative stress survival Svf1-like protein [Mycena floridula]|nr:oxidative stress survival Svf1-like protein [Mycena floridula]
MFSSFFSTSAPVDPTAPTLHPVSSRFSEDKLYGELTPNDTEWLCSGGFVTETQVFYTIGEDGTFLTCQVIHSSIGVWYPTVQFTCKIYDPKTKKTTWKSINVTNFVAPPPGRDKRSCKADEFSITYNKLKPDDEHPESYTIHANLAADLQIFLEVLRPASVPGFKVGEGEKGGYSYFGPDTSNAEGYVVHRFWPHYKATGHIVANGQATSINGPGMFIHAIQGMRPNLVASRWDFAYFHSEESGGVSAMQMDFTSCDPHGRKGAGSGGVHVNVGSLVVGGKLASITAETIWPDEKPVAESTQVSRVSHLNPVLDPETGYNQPTALLFEWSGPSLLKKNGRYIGKLQADVGNAAEPKGLVEKVDILAEIPYVIKAAVSYLAGTKPFMYQWFNPAKLSLTDPESKTTEIEGTLYNEATFIS